MIEIDFSENRIPEVKERFLLSGQRLEEIAGGESPEMQESFRDYFQATARYLTGCRNLYKKIETGEFRRMSLRELQEENTGFFRQLLPENYEGSYDNPDYAEKVLGEDLGKLLCFLHAELLSQRAHAFEQDMVKTVILDELFLEIYGMFAGGEVTRKQLRETIYWFFHDYAQEWCGWRVRQLMDPDLTFARDIVMNSDLTDLRYLYYYGEYVTQNEIRTAEYLNTLSQEEIDSIARTFTDAYREGFRQKGVDLSKKTSVNITYNLGFERIIRAAVLQFREAGLETLLYRTASSTLSKDHKRKNGFVSTSPNEQFEYDHHADQAIYLDKRMVDRKIECMRKAYEALKDKAAGYAGPVWFWVFGQDPFLPERKESAFRLSERQENLSVEYAALASRVANEFINQEEWSFTAVSYPTPAIGDRFEEIFQEIKKVNSLDNEKYKAIHQSLIDVLDRAESVHITGRGENMTNITVSLQEIPDPAKQTCFANCLADINIPVGEVYTSPKLEKTNGLLHVTEVFLDGCCFKNLKLWVEDGMITDYSCDNFPSAEEGKALIRENILFNRETIPMGEFAIGTNTTAFVVAEKYNIHDKLPILIAEKTGPHMAFGDTCFSYSEDVPVINPDGKEMIAKDNTYSLKRNESPMKAYFNCHTDITIPYGEIGQISAVMKDHNQVPIIIDGRFVLEGTLELNEPFAREEAAKNSTASGMETIVKQINEESARG